MQSHDVEAEMIRKICRYAAGLSGGAKAGIAIAVIAIVIVVAILLGIVLPCYKQSSKGWEKQALDQQFPLYAFGNDVEMADKRRPA